MKIKKIVADRKPVFCLECPLKCSAIKTLEKQECGKMGHITAPGGWNFGGMVPDERCLFEIEE